MTMLHLFRTGIAAATLILLPIAAHAEKPAEVPGEAAAPAGKLLTEVTFPDAKSLGKFVYTDPSAWRWATAEGGAGFMEHFKQSEYKYPVRSPFNIALLKDHKFGSFTMDMEVEQTGRDYGHRDLCFFFGAQDPSHFYYVHIATKSDPHAHNIMLVNGSPRTSISEKATGGHEWGDGVWHRIRIVRDIESGKIEVFANDMKAPIMTATDKTFGAGWLGFGSFDDTGRVRAIRIYGDAKEDAEIPFFTKRSE